MTRGHTEKLGPLSERALATLRDLARGTVLVRQEVNSGLARRLEQGGLVEIIPVCSPYRTRRGMVDGLRITDAGRAAVDIRL